MPAPAHETLTLNSLMERISVEPSLSSAQRSELCSAIRRFARICGKHPSEIIADPAVIRQWIGRANWQMAGLSKRGWANMISRLTRAMMMAEIKVHRRRRNFKLLPEWETRLEPLGRRDRDGLRRFAGWCSVHGIDPEKVNIETFDCYRIHLETETIQRNPRERWHVARRAWNRTLAANPDSGLPAVANVEPAGWRGLPWVAFPESLLSEIEMYKTAVTSANPFAGDERRIIKPITLKGYLNNLRWHLSRHVENGMTAGHFVSLADCVEPELVKRGLQLRLGGKDLDDKTKPALSAMMTAIISVAHFVDVSDEHYRELKRLADKVRHRQNGMTERNKERLAQFNEEHAMRALVNLPFRMANDLANITLPTVRQAQQMQMAALIAILLHLPLRIKNAAALDLDIHIKRPAGGADGRWIVHFASGEVKNEVAIDGVFNEKVSALLQRYVDVFRPILTKKPSSKFFISQHGTGKDPHTLSGQFRRLIRREIGFVMNAHLVRHWAAFAYLAANPGDYETVRQLLGHKNIATTINAYTGADTKSALGRYDHVIAARLDPVPLKFVKSPPPSFEAKAFFGLSPEDIL
ncbi:site-specific integrase [Ollibium composti]|uniref:Site-specific integrase n=1 Tax=Ollibium composti TaxID=2675109 RepID=A0ABY2Q1F7_9HYPH|nr:site-specific integrase [Mesorhizobium composti]THF54650.1 site-specific integrase [Mesorhizobium composti]